MVLGILTILSTVFNSELHNLFTHADIWVALLKVIILIAFVWSLVNVITFKKLAAITAQNNCADELKELKEVFEDYKKKTDEALRQITSGETDLKGIMTAREDIYKVMNSKFNDLEYRLNDEFYFIRLKSKFYVTGGLDWVYQNYPNNNNLNNTYSDDEKIQIRDHKEWKFKK